jgi:hypothetical protein
MPHLSQVNVLVYKVLPKFYIYKHTHTHISFVEIHQQPYEGVQNPNGGD